MNDHGTIPTDELRSRPAGRRRGKRYTQTRDFVSMLKRMVAAAGARVGDADVDDLVALVEIRKDLDEAIQRGIDGLREDGYTWESIGKGLGVTRQAALMRWGRKRDLPSATAS